MINDVKGLWKIVKDSLVLEYRLPQTDKRLQIIVATFKIVPNPNGIPFMLYHKYYLKGENLKETLCQKLITPKSHHFHLLF